MTPRSLGKTLWFVKDLHLKRDAERIYNSKFLKVNVFRKGKSGAASPIPMAQQSRTSPKAGGHQMLQVSVRLLQARKGAEGAHSPHRNQAISGLLLLHQARSDISRVSPVSQGHGLHPEEAAEEVVTLRTLPGIAMALASAGK